MLLDLTRKCQASLPWKNDWCVDRELKGKEIIEDSTFVELKNKCLSMRLKGIVEELYGLVRSWILGMERKYLDFLLLVNKVDKPKVKGTRKNTKCEYEKLIDEAMESEPYVDIIETGSNKWEVSRSEKG